jgi:hypothetical protein
VLVMSSGCFQMCHCKVSAQKCSPVSALIPEHTFNTCSLYIPFRLLLCFGFVIPVLCTVAVELPEGFFAWFGTAGRGFVAFFTTDPGVGWTMGDFCRNTLGEGNCMTSIRCGDERHPGSCFCAFPLRSKIPLGCGRAQKCG